EGVGVFRPGGARPPSEVMVGFIDDHREQFGVEPICRSPRQRTSNVKRKNAIRCGGRCAHNTPITPSRLWRSVRFAATSEVCARNSSTHAVNRAPWMWIDSGSAG